MTAARSDPLQLIEVNEWEREIICSVAPPVADNAQLRQLVPAVIASPDLPRSRRWMCAATSWWGPQTVRVGIIYDLGRARTPCMSGAVDPKTICLRLPELTGHPPPLTPRRVGTN
jgi:hypothetical protein